MTDEEKNLINHFKDLSVQSERRSLHRYTGFLNLPEQDLLQQGKREYATDFTCNGGFDGAERVVASFGNDECYDAEEFPISVLKIVPVNEKFATELTHRDYLGAIMGLGLERDRLGDIVINGHTALVYCISEIADYLAESLTSVGRTQVSCTVLSPAEIEETIERKFEEITVAVASERIDAVVAELARCSRGTAAEYIAAAKVFVNQREILSNSVKLKEEDIISIRGVGKFKYAGVGYVGKKGTMHLKFMKYV